MLSGTPAAALRQLTPSPSPRRTVSAPAATQNFTLTVNQARPSPAPTTRPLPWARRAHSPSPPPVLPHRRCRESGALPSGVTFNACHRRAQRDTAARDRRHLPHHVHRAQRRRHRCHAELHAHRESGSGHHQRQQHDLYGGHSGFVHGHATGFPAPTLSESGTLPSGVTFNPATGVLSGTPAAARRQLPPHLHRAQRRRHRRHTELHAHRKSGCGHHQRK